MSQKLRIARDLALPLDAVTETIAIVGIRGSGKTNTGVVLVEELLEQGQQVVVVDPTDVWWGLKSSADGKGPGYPVVILGGKHQDLPLEASAGVTIADFIVDNPVSVVCSLRHFESRGDQRRFVTDLARRLYFRKGQVEHPRPLMVVFDEASLFVPQRVMGEDAKMVGAIQQLVRQGRSSGFGVGLIDQRPATMNKDVLTQLELLVAHRITSPQDRKAIEAWVEQHDVEGQGEELLSSLASLERGTAWFWSPGWLDLFQKVGVRQRRTFDSSRTPKAGERIQTPTTAAAVDLAALKVQLSASIEKAKADDPVALRREIAQLQRDLKAARAQAPATDPAATEKAAAAARSDAYAHARRALGVLQREFDLGFRHTHLLYEYADSVDKVVAAFAVAEAALANGAAVGTPATVRASVARPPAAPARPPARAPGDVPAGGVGQRILDTIRAFEQLGITQPDRVNVAAWCSYHERAKSFTNALGALRSAGLIEPASNDGTLALTAAGRAAAGNTPPIASVEELHAKWYERLTGVQRRIVEAVVAAHPDPVNRDALAELLGYHPRAKSFINSLGRVRSLGLVDAPGVGQLGATKTLFPEGLR